MAQNFIAVDRDQAFLMPPSVRDWLPENHLAWCVLAAVAEMDLSRSIAGNGRMGGSASHEPQVMVALFLYSYGRGQRSSRVIERECVEDVAYRVVAGNLARTTRRSSGSVRTSGCVAGLFADVLRLCAGAGMARVGMVAVDGTGCPRTRRSSQR